MQYVILTLLLFLTGCSGPLSYVSYIVSGGVAIHAHNQQVQEDASRKYKEACVPTHQPEDPFQLALLAEAKKDFPEAYSYYTIAERLGYPQAVSLRERLVASLTEEQRTAAEEEYKKYTDANIFSCYEAKK